MFEIKLYLGYFPAILAKNTLKRQNTLFFRKSRTFLIKFFLRSGKKIYQNFDKCLKIKLYLGYFPAILTKNTLKRQNTLFSGNQENFLIKFFLRQSWTKYLRPIMIFVKNECF